MRKTIFVSMMLGAAMLTAFGVYAARVTPPLSIESGTEKVKPSKKYEIGSWVYAGNEAGPVAGATILGYFYVQPGSYLDGSSPVNQDSTVVTEMKTTQAATEVQVSMITDRIQEVFEGHESGKTMNIASTNTGGNAGSAHGGANPFGVWVRGGYNNIKDSTEGMPWNADLWTVALGGDYKFNGSFLAGLALTYGHLDGKTDFNKGDICDDAWGMAPYMGMRVNKNISFDITAGYNRVNKKRNRKAPSTNDIRPNFDGATVNSSPKSDRYFAASYANLSHKMGALDMLVRLGLLYGQDKQKAFTDSTGEEYSSQTNRFTQGNVRLELGYSMTNILRPYIFGTYARDFSDTKPSVTTEPINAQRINYNNPEEGIGKNVYGGGLGLGLKGTESLLGGLEFNYLQNKKLKNWGGNLYIRYRF
jgi:hypothetical protein